MRKSKLSLEKIAKILKEFDQGKSAQEVDRKYVIRAATFYQWRERYAGMNGKELKGIK